MNYTKGPCPVVGRNSLIYLPEAKKFWGNLTNDVRTYYSTLQPQELLFFRTAFVTL